MGAIRIPLLADFPFWLVCGTICALYAGELLLTLFARLRIATGESEPQ
jgi:hypothetical protein